MKHIQMAAKQIAEAMILLKSAKRNLLAVRSGQHAPLSFQLAAIEEIHGILTDPEETPEIEEGR